MTIESAAIVYVVAPSGTGKTFTGDYLDVVHGFRHVDGDGPMWSCALPRYREMTKGFLRTQIVPAKDEDGPKELWAPYFEELARQTLEAAEDHDKVILSHGTYRRAYRDFVVEKLVEGGVNMDQITIVQLMIDPLVKARSMYHRTKREVEDCGTTLEDVCKGFWGPGFEGSPEVGAFNGIYLAGRMDEEKFHGCENAKIVDISGRDISHCDEIDAALGLARSSDWSHGIICDAVKPVDERRAEESAASGSADAFAEVMAEIDSGPAIGEGEDGAKLQEIKTCSLNQVGVIRGSETPQRRSAGAASA